MHIVCSLDEAIARTDQFRREGKTIVTTNGTFDLFHPGHEFLLSQARQYGDMLIVGVNSDASVKRYKGPDRPKESQDIRAQNVSEHADVVFIFDDDDPRSWLSLLCPDIHVNAQTYGEDCIEADVLRSIGAKLVLVPIRRELGSTTERLQSTSPRLS